MRLYTSLHPTFSLTPALKFKLHLPSPLTNTRQLTANKAMSDKNPRFDSPPPQQQGGTASERPVSPPPASCKVVLAGTVASKLMGEVQAGLAGLGRTPLLVGFLANSDPAAKM